MHRIALQINPLKPDLTIVIFIHYIPVQFSTCSGWKWFEVGGSWKKDIVIIKQFHEFFVIKPILFRKLSQFSEMQNDSLMHREGLSIIVVMGISWNS